MNSMKAKRNKSNGVRSVYTMCTTIELSFFLQKRAAYLTLMSNNRYITKSSLKVAFLKKKIISRVFEKTFFKMKAKPFFLKNKKEIPMLMITKMMI